MRYEELLEKYGKKSEKKIDLSNDIIAEIKEAIETGLAEYEEIKAAPIINMACDMYWGPDNWDPEKDRAGMANTIKRLVKDLGFTWVKAEGRYKSAKIRK